MGRPQTKPDLLEAAKTNYDKLMKLIDDLTEKELQIEFDFSTDEKKKEAHWKRDKNVRDVLMHLYEWHNLMLKWIENNKGGIRKPFLMEGFNWKTYGAMNVIFWENCQKISLEEAKKLLDKSHADILKAIEEMSDEELFSKGAFDWVGGSTIGSYFVSVTSSHYDWAMKKIKAHKKRVSEM